MTDYSVTAVLKEASTSYVLCPLCSKTFQCTKYLKAHEKRMHNIGIVKKVSRIICPLCEERNELRNQHLLRTHLRNEHAINIELIVLEFSNVQEYEAWKLEQRIETMYARNTTVKKKECKDFYYICNRSDNYGYTPNYKIRAQKAGGTIKIKGMCPSRLICTLYDNGSVSVKFWKTHAGHAEKIRCQHLSISEKNFIVEKLGSGVTTEKILEDVKKIEVPKIQRINLINKKDIFYLIKKHNINRIDSLNESAADLKLQEKCPQVVTKQINKENYMEIQLLHLFNRLKSLEPQYKLQVISQLDGILLKVEQEQIENKMYTAILSK